MTYVPKDWSDNPGGGTPINAVDLDHIEQGIAAAHDGLYFVRTYDTGTSSYPVRGRTDGVCRWRGPVEPTAGGAYALPGDEWAETV